MHTELATDLPPRPLRVLHLTISLAPGGRRDAILALARATAPLGVESFAATLRDDPPEPVPEPSPFGGRLDLATPGRPGPRTALRLRDACRDWRIDVVHTHDFSAQFVASLLRIVAPTQHSITTYHRSLPFEVLGLKNKVRNGLTLLGVDRVVTASAERRQHFVAENLIPADRVGVIPLGVDMERFRPDPVARREIRGELRLEDGAPLLVAAGHFSEEKGIDQALRATALGIAGHSPGAHLVVLGRGSPEREAALRSLGQGLLGDRVTFVGYRSDPERWFAAADLLVHAPRLEAFGLVVVQAMACGAPVAAMAVGGVPEIVADGAAGALAPGGDVAALGRAIAEILASPQRRGALAAGALERARSEYDIATCAARYVTLYRQAEPR